MKEILSYWDILLGLLSIAYGINRRIKFEKIKKKRRKEMLRSGKYTVSYAKYMSNKFEYLMDAFFVTIGIIFIYYRLNGNLPNIIELIKEFASY